jgi:antitoxin component YwqK of YwqJK toxin-antitoxin module
MNKSKPTPLHEARELTADDVFVDNEIICLVKNGKPATGRVTAHHDDGLLDFRIDIYNGKRHGLYEEFFEDGNLRYWCLYSHGKKDFYDEQYDKYKRLIQSYTWRNGVLHGRCESYELGAVSAVQHFENGELHGLWEKYGARKVVSFHGHYVRGRRDGWHVWRYPNNKIEAEYHYELGVKTGRWRVFYDTGELMHERFYEDDKVVGEHRYYYDNGVLARVLPYVDGKLEGSCFDYHPNGTLKQVTPVTDGVRDGIERHYDRALKKRREITWEHGQARSDISFLFDPHLS